MTKFLIDGSHSTLLKDFAPKICAGRQGLRKRSFNGFRLLIKIAQPQFMISILQRSFQTHTPSMHFLFKHELQERPDSVQPNYLVPWV